MEDDTSWWQRYNSSQPRKGIDDDSMTTRVDGDVLNGSFVTLKEIWGGKLKSVNRF